jgi:hypothetical protein
MLLINNALRINLSGGERTFWCNPDRTCPMLVLFHLVFGTCLGIQRIRAVALQPPESPPMALLACPDAPVGVLLQANLVSVRGQSTHEAFAEFLANA